MGVAQPARLRAWQREALDAWEQARSRDFLVTATPGSGKTALALALARRLLDRREVARVVVVCPTDHLRRQWATAAAGSGVLLDPDLSNAVGPVRADLHGYVATYAQVAARPALHAARTAARRTLVVLDEVHHAGDGLSWGEAVRHAFDDARRRLSLTGTPFRTRADERIPFVRYDEDDDGLRSAADVRYGYADALADGVVRPVVFAAYTGTTRWRSSAGEVVAASLSEPGTREAEAAAWRTALDPRGGFVPHVVAAMDERLSVLRRTGMPDAAALVLASDQDDARAYARVVARVTGEEPVLVLSDDRHASARLAAFRDSRERVAVCVRMISEGVDVPRAACLAWLSSYRTSLFFAQAVGRVVRARRPGEQATVFLPAVRPLLALAAEMETERNHVTPPPRSSDPDDPAALDVVVPEREAAGLSQFEAIEADAEFAHLLHSGRAVLPGAGRHGDARRGDAQHGDAQHGDAQHDGAEDFLGLPGLLTPQETARLLADRDAEARRRAAGSRGWRRVDDGDQPAAAPAAPAAPGAVGAGDAAALRRELHALVGQVAARTGRPHAVVHAELRAAVPGPAAAAAPAELLARRRDHLLARLVG